MIIFDLDGTIADCDKDTLIIPVNKIFHHLHRCEEEVQIWSARCESVREKTIQWLNDHSNLYYCSYFDCNKHLKMRPLGNFTPDEQLKEKWLDEAIAEGKQIDYVFDGHDNVIDMWRRRGIFVFDVNKSGKKIIC